MTADANVAGEITAVLARVREGERQAEEDLARLVYADLRRIAVGYMRRESAGHTLQPSALVNEAFVKLVKQVNPFEDRQHFFAMASSWMRRILVDHARKKKALRHGGGQVHVRLGEDGFEAGIPARDLDVLAIDAALDRLAQLNERQARVVEMRFFGGMQDQEIANALGVTVRTVLRDWRAARAWLHAELAG